MGTQRRFEAKFGVATASNNSDYLKRKLAGQCGMFHPVLSLTPLVWSYHQFS